MTEVTTNGERVNLGGLIYKPGHNISYKTVCAPNSNPDQPAHLCRLISLCNPSEDILDPWLPTECPVNTDQTAWKYRLI